MIRLFVGLKIPDEIKQRLVLLKGGIENARWIEPDNMHITLAFIGDVQEDIAADIDEKLSQITFEPFELYLKETGFFGAKKPRALWAGVSKTPEFKDLFFKVQKALKETGISLEKRKFKPHVTIARFKNVSKGELMEFVSHNSFFETEPFTVSDFALFSSILSHKGAKYSVERLYIAI